MTQIPQDLQNFLAKIASDRGVSKAELEALSLALEGVSTREIAASLGISAIAVRKRLGEVYRKFNIEGNNSGKLAEFKRQLQSRYQGHPPVPETAAPSLGDTPPYLDLGEAPNVIKLYGRDQELATLQQWIVQDRCRLVALLGLPGIGKTALARSLVEEVKQQFEYVMWRSLRYTPTLQAFLADLPKIQATNLSEDVDQSISQLIDFFKEHRCLLILDNVESIVASGSRTGRYKQGHENFGLFLRRVAEESHKSCLLLSGQEKLKDISLLEKQQLVCSYLLNGLKPEEVKQFLQSQGLESENRWDFFIQNYPNNPLALKLVVTEMKDYFSSSIDKFIEFSLSRYGGFEEVISRQFNRFSELEKKITQCFARENKPLSLFELNEMMPEVRPSDLLESLESLKARSWIEIDNNKILLSLQPVVQKFLKKYPSPSNTKP